MKCIHGVPEYALCGICQKGEMEAILKDINHEWTTNDGACPYCKKESSCEHWRGHGWIKNPITEAGR